MISESSKVIESVINYFESDINKAKELLISKINQSNGGDKIIENFIDVLYDLIAKQAWRIINKTFVYEFHEFRKQKGLPISKTSSLAYEMFLSEMNKDVIGKWLKKYTVLHGILQDSILNSCKFITEVFYYYAEDKSLLIDRGFLGRDAQINKITLLDSDPHNNGKIVLLFEDTDCRKFIFKNRDFKIDNLIDDIFKTLFLNAQKNMESPIPQNIIRDGYGWQKFVEQVPVIRANVGVSFYNLGYYSVLFSVLGASDLHDENLIFRGEVPYFIDLETALHPRLNSTEQSLIGELQNSITKSIAHTTIIPSKLLNNSYNYLIGAINTPYPQETEKMVFSFKNLGTDAIDIAKEKVVLDRLATPLSCTDGKIIDPVNYYDDFLSGYKSGFIDIMNNKTMISKKVESFKGDIRVVLRPTAQYFLIMDACLYPENLIDYSSAKKILHYLKPISFIKDKTIAKMIYDEECKSLLQGDIPYFKVESDSLNLVINSNTYKRVYSVSAITNALENLKCLSDSQLLFDYRLISEGFSEIKIRNSKKGNVNRDNSKMYIDLLRDLKNGNFEKLLDWWKAQSVLYEMNDTKYRAWHNGSYGELPALYSTPTLISFHDIGGVEIMLESLLLAKGTSNSRVIFEEARNGLIKLRDEVYAGGSGDYHSIIAGEESVDFILSKSDKQVRNLELKVKNSEIPIGDVFKGKLGIYLVLASYSRTCLDTMVQGEIELANSSSDYSKFGLAHGKLGELWTKFRIYAKLDLNKECKRIYSETLKCYKNGKILPGWCNGYSGLLMVLVEMSKVLNIKIDYFELALKCVDLPENASIDLSVCHGTSGVIQSLLFCYIVTKDKRYIELADSYWNLVYKKAQSDGFYIGESNREYLLGYMMGWSGVIDTILLLNLVKDGRQHWIPLNLSTIDYQEQLKKETCNVIGCSVKSKA